MAMALHLAVAIAAEPAPSLVGSSQEQVVRKKGEPRSQIAVGNRIIMLYARERVVLRDGVVVEVEQVHAEPVRRAPPPPVAQTAPAAATEPAPAAAGTALPPGTAGVAAAPAVPAATPDSAAPPAQPPEQAATKVEPPPEPKLEIKLVRPPSANSPLPQSRKAAGMVTERPPPAPTPVATPPPKEVPPRVEPVRPTADSPAVSPPPPLPASLAHRSTVAPAPSPKKVSSQTVAPPAAEDQEKSEAELAAAVAADKKARKIKASRRRLEATLDTDEPDIAESFFSTQTYVIAFVTIAASIGFLVWRNRQRQLALAVTAVTNTPFSAPVSGGESSAAMFAAELIAKLEWKRFEELVEAYYIKTGVVAVRTKTGPASPVHIKISWKGEPRPFACVHCIAHPIGLIEVKPLQELFAVLTADDIRRGYLVTTGRFSVAARDYAEEKHLTLLPGEIFLEKLNALPGTARSEIMQAITTGDYTTPSCPKCDTKMVRTKDGPPVWRCATHSDCTIPARD